MDDQPPPKKKRGHICPHCQKSFASRGGFKYHLDRGVCQQPESNNQVDVADKDDSMGIVEKGNAENVKNKLAIHLETKVCQPANNVGGVQTEEVNMKDESPSSGNKTPTKVQRPRRSKRSSSNAVSENIAGAASNEPNNEEQKGKVSSAKQSSPVAQRPKRSSSKAASEKIAGAASKKDKNKDQKGNSPSAEQSSSKAQRRKRSSSKVASENIAGAASKKLKNEEQKGNTPSDEQSSPRGQRRKRSSSKAVSANIAGATNNKPKNKDKKGNAPSDEQSSSLGKAGEKFEVLKSGSKFITKFGIVEVIVDERIPLNHHKTKIDQKLARSFWKRRERYCERKKRVVDQIAAGGRYRREELKMMYLQSKSTKSGTSIMQKKVWDLYCKSLSTKQILNEGLSWGCRNDDFKRRNNKIDTFDEVDPCSPKDHYPDRIVECKLIEDERRKIVGSGSDGIMTHQHTDPKARHQKKTVPMRLFIARRELTKEYNSSGFKYQCSICGKAYLNNTGLKYHLLSCKPNDADKKKKQLQQIEGIESKALLDSNCHDALLTSLHAAIKPTDIKAKDIPPSFGNPHKIKEFKKHRMPPWLVFNAQRSTMYPEIYLSLGFRRGSQNRNHYNKKKQEEGYAERAEKSRLRKRLRKMKLKNENSAVKPTRSNISTSKKAVSTENLPVKDLPHPSALIPLSSTSSSNTIGGCFGDGENGKSILNASPRPAPPEPVHNELYNTKRENDNSKTTAGSLTSDGVRHGDSLHRNKLHDKKLDDLKDGKKAKRKKENSAGSSAMGSRSNGNTGGASASVGNNRHKIARPYGEPTDLNDIDVQEVITPNNETFRANIREKEITDGSHKSLNDGKGAISKIQTAPEASATEGSIINKKSQRPLMNKNKNCVVIDVQVLAMECESGRYPTINRFRGTHEPQCTLCKNPGETPLINCDFCKNSVHQLCLDKRMLLKDPQVIIRENEPDDTPMCNECISICLFRRWRAENRRVNKWQHELSKAGLGDVPEAASLSEEINLKGSNEGIDDPEGGAVEDEPTFKPCPDGGPGGLICCEYCTAAYSRFLSNTAKEMEAQSVSRVGQEVSEILELLADAKKRLYRASEVTQSNEERRGLLDKNQTSHIS